MMTATLPLIDRASGLGATDISAIVGMNPWRSAFDVWAEKTGQLDPAPESQRMTWGRRLQRVIAEAYSEETGRPHVWLDKTQRHRSRGWHIWTPDATCVAELRGVDCKTAGLDQADKWGEAGTDDVPDYVALQCHWSMAGEEDFKAWDVALLLAGNDFRVYTIPRDTDIEAILIERAAKFWRDNVLGGKEPEIKDTDAARRYLAKKFPVSSGKLRTPTPEELAMLEAYRAGLQARRALVDAVDDIAMKVRLAIGEDDGFEWNRQKVTYKRCKDGARVDWESIALPLLAKEPEETRNILVGLHTQTVPGTRRIYHKFDKEK